METQAKVIYDNAGLRRALVFGNTYEKVVAYQDELMAIWSKFTFRRFEPMKIRGGIACLILRVAKVTDDLNRSAPLS